MKLYALWDKKSGLLSSFHVEKSDAVASRGFMEAVNAPNSLFGKYPEDFSLVAIAAVSDVYEFGREEPVVVDGVQVVITAAQVVAMRAPEQLSLIKEA